MRYLLSQGAIMPAFMSVYLVNTSIPICDRGYPFSALLRRGRTREPIL